MARPAVQVYLGRWRWHGLVAVKRLIKADQRREQAFVHEAELLQALRHPNIVSFLGACLEPGRVRCSTRAMCWSGWMLQRKAMRAQALHRRRVLSHPVGAA